MGITLYYWPFNVYYLGKKLGLTPAGFDDAKAMQCLLDIQDLFEGNVGKNNEDGPTMKKFIEGPRFAALMGNLERAIKGPYFMGESPTCVDFFLLGHLDSRIASLFDPLKAKHGVDALAPYPKCLAIRAALRESAGYKASTLSLSGPITKQEVLDAYHN
eukprot:CAMPEP_0181171006 /NCGR_PEP_ID=MMETSP1096-20121128/1671_1 /TAXON_ID=156174 ORGANISM="Chrysochromulina ericina, Strain CCMP281" /NCGR_SAMPLE_ID=MMETSP1096 /ASSEMBLY_ACC=CAM_ASM_000453 /LENGTH=158 /DNA_ID=CAMNT_0023258609 /DNA_START=528 /DNA_END=1005 /DNA_ORIENTATION=+